MTDDELNRRFDAMMERLNDAQEAIIERVRACETLVAALNTTMTLAVTLLTDIARRVTDLEKKA